MSKIEWTERSWNPIVGCSKVSEGCKNCYAIRMAWRHSSNPITIAKYSGTVEKTCGGKINWTGSINVLSDVMLRPLQVKKPTIWFVNSMSDLFHENLDDETLLRIFRVMKACPHHIFQVVTKRAARAADFLQKYFQDPLPNVWIGFSIENHNTMLERVSYLHSFNAAKKFVSCEPLLGPVSFKSQCLSKYLQRTLLSQHIDWVIVGGESGPDARPMHPEWARSLRDECTAAGVAFFFKQWGEWAPDWAGGNTLIDRIGATIPGNHNYMEVWKYKTHEPINRIGKKAAGRLLDGREWNEMPKGNFSPVKNMGDE